MRMLGYQGIEKQEEMQGRGIGFRVAMRPGKRRVRPDTPGGRLDDLIETARVHICAKGEHPLKGNEELVRLSEDPAAGNALTEAAGRTWRSQ